MQMAKAKEEARKRQEEYSKTLSQQVNAANINKQIDGVMTEHERRVNDADIRAYQSVDVENLYHKIPGIRRYGEDAQENYIEKAFARPL